jgi:hypothetical protein
MDANSPITFKQAYDVFAKTLKEDKGLYYSYQSNIAMCIYDAITREGYRFPDFHTLVNKGACAFLDLLIEKGE